MVAVVPDFKDREQNSQFQSTISTRYCVDDDYDDSGGRTQRDCLSLTAPDRGKDKYSLYLALVEIQTLSGY